MDFTYNIHLMKKTTTLLNTHTSLSRGITSSVLPPYLFNCGRTHLYCSGCEVGARSKDKDFPQPDGSIPSGSTVDSN